MELAHEIRTFPSGEKTRWPRLLFLLSSKKAIEEGPSPSLNRSYPLREVCRAVNLRMDVLYGVHPVEEAIRSGSRQLDHVSFAPGSSRCPAGKRWHSFAGQRASRTTSEPREQLTRMAKNRHASGLSFAFLREREFLTIGGPARPPLRPGPSLLPCAGRRPRTRTTWALCSAPQRAPGSTALSCRTAPAPLTAVVAKSSAGGGPSTSASPAVTNLVRALGRG